MGQRRDVQRDLGPLARALEEAIDNLQHGAVFSATVAFLVGCSLFFALVVVYAAWLVLELVGLVSGNPSLWLTGCVTTVITLIVLGRFWKSVTVRGIR